MSRGFSVEVGVRVCVNSCVWVVSGGEVEDV